MAFIYGDTIMLRFLCAMLVFMSGCASIPTPVAHLGPRVGEPTRTMFMIQCISSNLPITACLCFEEVLVRMKGADAQFTQLDMSVAQQKCMEVVKPLLDKEMEKPQQKLLKKEEERKKL